MADQNRAVLVYFEEIGTCLELLGKARDLADASGALVCVASLGEDPDDRASELGTHGADRVYVVKHPRLKHFNVESHTAALADLVAQATPEVVLLAATKRGLELAPRVAARLGSACVSSCTDVRMNLDTGEVEAQAMIYSGLGLDTYLVTRKPAVLLVAPGTFSIQPRMKREASVVHLHPEIGPAQLEILDVKPKAARGIRLEDAQVVVDVGQGLRREEDLTMVRELADVLGGQVACTRPVSSERGWFPEWLGLSGRRVSPRLCITLGVSGAIQHFVGIRDSKVIVAVDSREDSAMLAQSDFGVLADLYEFVPALTQALKARRLGAI